MEEMHKVGWSPRSDIEWALHQLWWSIRGVTNTDDYLAVCARCRQRGMTHYTTESIKRCIRFKRA